MDESVLDTADLLAFDPITCDAIELTSTVAVREVPAFERPLQPSVREIPVLKETPWIRSLGKLTVDVTTQGWRFPTPEELRDEGRGARDEKDKISPLAP